MTESPRSTPPPPGEHDVVAEAGNGSAAAAAAAAEAAWAFAFDFRENIVSALVHTLVWRAVCWFVLSAALLCVRVCVIVTLGVTVVQQPVAPVD